MTTILVSDEQIAALGTVPSNVPNIVPNILPSIVLSTVPSGVLSTALSAVQALQAPAKVSVAVVVEAALPSVAPLSQLGLPQPGLPQLGLPQLGLPQLKSPQLELPLSLMPWTASLSHALPMTPSTGPQTSVTDSFAHATDAIASGDSSGKMRGDMAAISLSAQLLAIAQGFSTATAHPYVTPAQPASTDPASAQSASAQSPLSSQLSQWLSPLQPMNLMLTHILPHSIKNPLTGILGLSDLLNQNYDTMTQTDMREIVDGIHSSAQKLHHLIQNFLFYTNLECAIADPSQLFALQQQRVVYPSNVIGDAALQAAHRAERQADLRLDLKDVILPMAELHLQKLVAELVDNAFQYSEPGTPVSVSSQIETLAEGLLYTLTISDRGRGMTSEQIANLTADLLHPPSPLQISGYASTKPGLGWAIAQRLTTLHHGKLAIYSVPKQHTTVQIRFPILAIVLPAPSESPSDALSAAL